MDYMWNQDRSTGVSTGNTDVTACICKKTEYYQRPVEEEEGEDKKENEDEEAAALSNVTDLTASSGNTLSSFCVPCPVGGDCSLNHGMKAPEITALPGYWRANNITVEFTSCAVAFSSSIFALQLAKRRCCPKDNITNTSICSGIHSSNPDSQCAFMP